MNNDKILGVKDVTIYFDEPQEEEEYYSWHIHTPPKRASDKPILDSISLDIHVGEVIGFLGKSGAGKTSLMNCIRGIPEYRPTSGEVIFNVAICENEECRYVDVPSQDGEQCPKCGKTMHTQEVDYWNELDNGTRIGKNIYDRMSMMTQRTFALYSEKTAIENLINTLQEVEKKIENPKKYAIDLLKRVRLLHRATKVARDMSGGEKQRVILARQLAKEPMLLLADEPTGTLDPITAQIISEIFREEAKRGLPIILTSHLPELIVHTCDQAILLERGKMTLKGSPDEVVASYLGRAGQDEIDDELELHSEPQIVVEHVKKHYYSVDKGLVKSVDNVDLTILRGEIFGIVGVSGAGKTTLVKMISGITNPTSGKVKINIGEEWIDMSIPGPQNRGKAKSRIGFLHQEFDLYPHSTVLENLTDSIGLELPKELSRAMALEMMESVGFEYEYAKELLETYPPYLSGGEKHRIAIARELMRSPEIIILDEPTGTLDPITTVSVIDAIKKSRRRLGQTYVVVTHDMSFAEKTCDRIALMRGGKILDIGPPEKVLAKFRLETIQES
jgi:methyl coenzyme M reductase system subunit A2